MKYKIIAAVIALAATFYAGRQSAPTPEIKAEVAKTIDKEERVKTVTIKKKDGTVKTVTTKDTSVKSQTTSKTEVAKSDKVHVQLMYGTDLTKVDQDRHTYYGLAVSKTLVGPLTGGLFLLIDGKKTPVGGLTLGWEL